MRFHPYALIIGIGIGVMVFATLRHPGFAAFAGLVSIVLLDMGYKRKIEDKDE